MAKRNTQRKTIVSVCRDAVRGSWNTELSRKEKHRPDLRCQKNVMNLFSEEPYESLLCTDLPTWLQHHLAHDVLSFLHFYSSKCSFFLFDLFLKPKERSISHSWGGKVGLKYLCCPLEVGCRTKISQRIWTDEDFVSFWKLWTVEYWMCICWIWLVNINGTCKHVKVVMKHGSKWCSIWEIAA